MGAKEGFCARLKVSYWLDSDPGQESEEAVRLEENCLSRSHRVATKWIDFCFKLASLELVEQRAADEDNQLSYKNERPTILVKNTVKYRSASTEPPLLFSGSRLASMMWRSRFVGAFSHVFLVYYALKFFLVVAYRFQFDSTVKKWSPLVRDNVSSGALCANKNDIIDMRADAVEEMESYRRMLDALGDPFISVSGGAIVYYTFSITCSIILYIVNLILTLFYDIKIDCLGFLLQPVAHLAQIQLERHHNLANLLDCFGRFTENLQVAQRKKLQLSSRNGSGTEKYDYVKIMLSIGQQDLVRPKNLRSRWHKLLTYLLGYLLKYYVVGTLLIMTAASFLLHLLESYLRAKQRVRQLLCQSNSTTLIKPRIHLVEVDPEDRRLYLRDLNPKNHLNLAYLGLISESKYFIRWPQIGSFLELMVMTNFCATIFSLLMFLYAATVLDKLVWLRQLREQLETGISRLSDARLNDGSSDALKALTIAYLNFTLFIQRYSSFKRALDRLITGPLVLVVSIIVVSAYGTTNSVDAGGLIGIYVLGGISVLLLLLNFLLLGPALIVSQVQQRIKLICVIMASIDSHPPSHGLLFLKHQWRRQLLSGKNMSLLLATNTFGLQVTPSKLVTINSYLLGLWLFLYRRLAGHD